jgi:hypothetical protein
MLAVGLSKVRRTQAEQISQHAGVLFFQREEFFPS